MTSSPSTFRRSKRLPRPEPSSTRSWRCSQKHGKDPRPRSSRAHEPESGPRKPKQTTTIDRTAVRTARERSCHRSLDFQARRPGSSSDEVKQLPVDASSSVHTWRPTRVSGVGSDLVGGQLAPIRSEPPEVVRRMTPARPTHEPVRRGHPYSRLIGPLGGLND